jgi:hypothetical protein
MFLAPSILSPELNYTELRRKWVLSSTDGIDAVPTASFFSVYGLSENRFVHSKSWN